MSGIEAVGHMVSKLKSHVLLAVFSGLAACLLNACGGGSDAPVVITPPVATVPPVVPRVWSAPQLSNIWVGSADVVRAYPDACGGVTLLVVQNPLTRVNELVVSRHFSPATGWKQTLPLSFLTSIPQALNVNGALLLYYHDDVMWQQARFDCASDTWSVSAAFQYDSYPNSISFTETFDHNVVATSRTEDGLALNLREFRAGTWSAPTRFGVSSSPVYSVPQLSGATVIRTKDGDVGGFARYDVTWFEFRPNATSPFSFVTDSTRGCGFALGNKCILVPRWSGFDIQPDGSVTNFSGTGLGNPDWFRVGASGLSLLNVSSKWPVKGPSIVRADGTPQWLSVNPDTKNAEIIEASMPASWITASSQKRFDCGGNGCRLFARPDATHIASITDLPAIALSDRVAGFRWEGTEELGLAALKTAYNDPRGPTTFGFTLSTYYADAKVQIILGVMTRTFAGSQDATPFVLWK